MILICVKCEKQTTEVEASTRVFNTGRCGHCGSNLTEPKRHRENLAQINYHKNQLYSFKKDGYST